jgi:omega-6 fatty acid desaturase (delta-12 desaturase)
VPLVVLLALAPMLADAAWWAPWLLAPGVGLLFYRLTIVMHDCTHGTLFAARRTNRWVGAALGAVTGVDFASFKRQHWKHHRDFGRPGDPQGFQYLDVARMTGRAFLWHLTKPLFGANLRHAFPESVFAPANLVRAARSGELLLVFAAQLALLAVVTGFGRHWQLAVLPYAAAGSFSLFFSQLRGIAEHAVAGDASPAGHVRSHAPHALDALLLVELNFHRHAEHHAQPGIPSFRLQEGPAMQGQSMFGTLRDIHAALRKAHG